jgi:hypothetical protein
MSVCLDAIIDVARLAFKDARRNDPCRRAIMEVTQMGIAVAGKSRRRLLAGWTLAHTCQIRVAKARPTKAGRFL